MEKTFNPEDLVLEYKYDLVESEFEDTKPHIDKNTYFISDLHLGKPNASCSEDYYETINKVVGENDTLIVVGDIGFRKDANRLQKCSDFFRRINCNHMYLVLGNHDIDDFDLYRAMGFKGIFKKITTPKYTITHEPVGIGKDRINIHGHIHKEGIYANGVDWHNHINVFWKIIEKPRRLEELLKMLEGGKFTGKTVEDKRHWHIDKMKAPAIKVESAEAPVTEEVLSYAKRKDMDTNKFGLPRTRRYPLNDKAHVMDAIRKFNYVEKENESELAYNILRAMKKYNISDTVVGEKNRLLSYMD